MYSSVIVLDKIVPFSMICAYYMFPVEVIGLSRISSFSNIVRQNLSMLWLDNRHCTGFHFLFSNHKQANLASVRTWLNDFLLYPVKPQSDIHYNRSATSPRLTISTDRRGRNKVPDRSRRGCREVGD